MKLTRRMPWGFTVLALCLAAAIPLPASAMSTRGAADTFNYDRFGTVTIYRGRGRPHDAILLVSGDDGWNAATGALAQRLADKGTVVAGIDFRHYRDALEKASESCVSPAADLENLSHYLQSKLALSSYLVPILVGHGSGATLVYATLAEAPDGLFKGALSIGFSTDLTLKKALCDNPAMTTRVRLDAGAMQGVTVSAASRLPGKWIVLLGGDQAAGSDTAMRAFIAAVPGAQWVPLPKTGPDYQVDVSWMPAIDAAVGQLEQIREGTKPSALPAALADLPLIVVPPPAASGGQWFGIFLTGDGGWVGLDKGVSLALAEHDIPIIGWDSLKYFWKRRTPDGASRDLDRVLRYYAQAWGRTHVLLIGYSQGADTMPFMFNRLPPATHQLVGYSTLLGISDNALWEFHVATWLGKPPKGIPTAPELERWSGSPYLCIYGESDSDAACEQETGHDGTALKLAGGHHFGGGYGKIADEILSRLPSTPGSVTPRIEATPGDDVSR